MKSNNRTVAAFVNVPAPSIALARVLPIAERLSVPNAGRTVLSAVRIWGRPILEATNRLNAHLSRVIEQGLIGPVSEQYCFVRKQDSSSDDAMRALRQCSSSVILGWLGGRTLGALSPTATLSDAEKWFIGDNASSDLLSRHLTFGQQRDVIAPLRELDASPRLLDILPYAAEVFETGNEMLFALGSGRQSKKARGIYYTPSDVSDYITKHCWDIAERSVAAEPPRWIDPACGTGSFLLSALYETAARLNLSVGQEAIDFASENLFGFDISATALQSAAFVISLACLRSECDLNEPLANVVRRIGSNLAVLDATTIDSLDQISSVLPALRQGADFLVSNPPYVWIERSHSNGQTEMFPGAVNQKVRRGNTYTDFVNMMDWLLKPEGGVGGMVTPLSISFSSRPEFDALRASIQKTGGHWQFAHFDRTPDSLFGDDVKTRNCIVFHRASLDTPSSIYTTDLMRWNSRRRSSLFQGIEFVRVGGEIGFGIPKLGSRFASTLLEQLTSVEDRPTMSCALKRIDPNRIEGSRVLACGGTAYNWLPFELLASNEAVKRTLLGDKLSYWSTAPGLETAMFAILQSRLVFWLWRVWGDGFHLTDEFIGKIPLSIQSLPPETIESLDMLGTKLWDEMQHHKIEKSNAGKSGVSYCSYVCVDQLDLIDLELAAALGLPKTATDYLKEFVREVIVAGREGELATNRALTKVRISEVCLEDNYESN